MDLMILVAQSLRLNHEQRTKKHHEKSGTAISNCFHRHLKLHPSALPLGQAMVQTERLREKHLSMKPNNSWINEYYWKNDNDKKTTLRNAKILIICLPKTCGRTISFLIHHVNLMFTISLSCVTLTLSILSISYTQGTKLIEWKDGCRFLCHSCRRRECLQYP